MPTGSLLSEFDSFKISSADGKSYSIKNNFFSKTGVKLIGLPHIGFRTRAREIFNLFKEIKKVDKILDAGCGYGIYSLILAKKGYKVESLDLEKERIKEFMRLKKQNPKLDKKIKLVEGNLTNLPYENETFDVILCSDVIEHIKNDIDAVSELVRVLRKGGKLILSVPHKSRHNEKTFKEFGHERPGYDLTSIQKICDDEKISCKKIVYYDLFFGKRAFALHNKFKNKIIVSLLFYPFYILSFLDKFFPLGEPDGVIFFLEKN